MFGLENEMEKKMIVEQRRQLGSCVYGRKSKAVTEMKFGDCLLIYALSQTPQLHT